MFFLSFDNCIINVLNIEEEQRGKVVIVSIIKEGGGLKFTYLILSDWLRYTLKL